MPPYTLGLDIGGTKIQAGLVNSRNRATRLKKTYVRNSSKQSVLRTITEVIRSFPLSQVRSIGVGITGIVDPVTGLVTMSPNLPRSWRNVPLKRLLERAFHKPTFVDNDAHCIALAEAITGIGRTYPAVLCLTLGTGIGAGLVINKKIYRGGQNLTEFGHICLSRSSSPCSCGCIGHFEALVSGPGMSKLYYSATHRKKNPFEIEAEALAGHRAAKRVVATMAAWLARGLASAIHAYGPSIIVLNGGFTNFSMLIRQALRLVPHQLLDSSLRRTPIVVSRLKEQAGVIGAALITRTPYRT